MTFNLREFGKIVFAVWLFLAPYIYLKILTKGAKRESNDLLYRMASVLIWVYVAFVMFLCGVLLFRPGQDYTSLAFYIMAWSVLSFLVVPFGFIHESMKRSVRLGKKSFYRLSIFLMATWFVWIMLFGFALYRKF